MQIRFLASVCFMAFLFCTCTEQTSQPYRQTNIDSTESHIFFPVTEYILGQLSEMDSLPVTPLKIISHNGIQDSVWMKKENIRSFAKQFLHPHIDSAYLGKFYEKKSFFDQTINSITLTYDLKNNQSDLKTLTVYISPKNNKVTRIYMVKEVPLNSGVQTLQLTWNTYKWCKITTITEQPESNPDIKEEMIKWDFSE